MSIMEYFLNLSLPYLILAVFLALVLASEIGFWVGFYASKLISRRDGKEWESQLDDNVATITNSSLALLALFLGFTFSSAMGHFEKNIETVENEAMVINTALRYSDLLKEPYSSKIKNELKTYTDIRLKLNSGELGHDAIKQISIESVTQRQALWSEVKDYVKANPDSQINDSFISSVIALAQAESSRTASLLNEVPKGLYAPIVPFLLFNGILFGASLGETAKRRLLLSWGMYLLIALAVGIIVELDKPLQGVISVDQEAMVMLRDKMK